MINEGDRFQAVVTAVYPPTENRDSTAVYFKSDDAALAGENRIVAYYKANDPMLEYLVKGASVQIYQNISATNGKAYWNAIYSGDTPVPAKQNAVAVQALTAEQKVAGIENYIKNYTGLYADVYRQVAEMAVTLNADLTAEHMDAYALNAEGVRTITTGMMIQIDRQYRIGQ